MLGLDVGGRWIGVAVSEGRVAVPLTIIEHTNRTDDVGRVAAIATEERATAVVVGLPVDVSGGEGEQAKVSRRFGDALAKVVGVPVVYHDETLSTADVQGGVGRRRGGRGSRSTKPRVDDLAAAVILQRYIDDLERAV
jgi:putative Holliday junction resolvase